MASELTAKAAIRQALSVATQISWGTIRPVKKTMHLISCFSRHTRPSSSTDPQRSTRSNASRQTKNPHKLRVFCLRSGDSRIFEQIFVLTNDMLSVYPGISLHPHHCLCCLRTSSESPWVSILSMVHNILMISLRDSVNPLLTHLATIAMHPDV